MIHGLDICFEGITEDQFYSRDDSRVSVLSGTNNCGKTLILKHLFTRFGETCYLCGTNRYYAIEHFPVYSEQPKYVMPFQDVFIRMTDAERQEVYRICSNCLGEDVDLDFVEPGNSMSNSFLKIGPTPLAKCSSGSRMLIHLISVLLTKRFEVVLIEKSVEQFGQSFIVINE